jgi:tyrosine-protein phosphatase non-receptor type 13 protein
VNGQTVEVNCKSDAYVGSVFDSVVEYFNVPEHTFFGLAVIRDSEYFFLDNEQRLEKYAPPGWKNPKKGNQERYMLYLRFRYYPKKLEFIKTPTTTHSLYLQLRQDILYDSLKPKRDKLFQLAALALQSEFGDKPTFVPKMGPKVVQYFQLQHYLPPRAFVDQESSRIENNLSEIHSHYSGQSTIQSEKQFIELCQSESDYGAHYYRVYKFKPSSTSPNTNQINDVFKIAILPDGLGICSQQGTLQPAHTKITNFHPWHMIRTLQFDRKRFLIATIENNIAQDHVFYTDHYTKSSYLVRFAASQHRFMMKMRHWQFTLSRDRPAINKDIGIERSTEIDEKDSQNEQPFAFATMPKRNIPEKQQTVGLSESRSEETPRRGTQNSAQQKAPLKKNPFEESSDNEKEEEGPQRIHVKIILEKDPSTGLGLTLVDGAVEDIKGVYVKSVSLDGDAKRKGIEKGDCIQAINGISLVDKTRHDAVELVKQSGREVELDIMRFPCITQILGHERQTSKDESLVSNGIITKTSATNNNRKQLPTKDELLVGKRPSVSRTPPPNRKTTPASKNIRQRAASDFGALGDTLPTLKSEDLLAGFEKARRRTRSNSGSDESDGEVQKGEYRLPVTSIYNFHASDEEDEDVGKPNNQGNNSSSNYPIDDTTSWVSKSTMESTAQKSVQSYPQ